MTALQRSPQGEAKAGKARLGMARRGKARQARQFINKEEGTNE